MNTKRFSWPRMNRLATFLASSWLTMVSVTVAAENIAPVSTGERYLERFLDQTKSLSADFQQTLRNHHGEVLQKSHGRFYLLRPGRFRWNYEQPYQQEIVSDGEKVWIYDVDLEQVTVQRQGAALSNTPMALLENSLKLHQQFDVVPLDHSQTIYRLKLISKDANSDFGEVVVGVDESGLRFIQLHDQFEQVTDIAFDHMNVNTPLSETLFAFNPPQGVDVFGDR